MLTLLFLSFLQFTQLLTVRDKTLTQYITTMCKFAIPQVDVNATADERRKAYFDALYSADLSEEIEKKNGLSYISWSQAWKVMKQFYPSANYTIHTNPITGQPFWESEIGLMVHTSVEADGIEYHDWLPVMDYNNRSMKTQSYSVNVYDKFKKQYVEKRVEAATTFDINSAIQRSMVRCLARHGLGLYIYNGFDHLADDPNDADTSSNRQQYQKQNYNRPAPTMKPTTPAPTMQTPDPNATLRNAINATTEVASLVSLYLDNTQIIEGNAELKALLTNRKKALQSLNAA